MASTDPQTLCIPGLTASADLSAKQYHLVKMSGDNTVTVCAAVTDVPIGVLQNKPESGEAATVCTIGVTKIKADEALAAGEVVGSSSDGQGQVVVIGTETTVYAAGIVIDGAASGGLATAVVNCASPNRAA